VGDALAAPAYEGPPVWLHGDLHPANILVRHGRVSGVIDFGDITSGDPAADLSVAWMLLPLPCHHAFRLAYRSARLEQAGLDPRTHPVRRHPGEAITGTLVGMAVPFAVRFAKARARYGPLVLGADPHGPLLEEWGLTDTPDGLERFTDIVLAAATGTVGLIKPQSAFYERHGWRGIRALTRLIESARGDGILVVLDVKRGDVGSTNDAYAQAYLGAGAAIEADAVTVHPYLGLAAMGSFIDRAHQAGACLLVVTRSSNPEGRSVQAARAATGSLVDQQILKDIGALNARLAPGEIGPVGAVVGPATIEPPLDLAAANALFLAPGVGAQGAAPADVARTFSACPERVLPSASRSLLAAGPDPAALGIAAARLNDQFRALLPALG
jgi:orotidine-5'-phosphate decarboxylase